MTDLVVLVPMLGRAHRVEPVLTSIRSAGAEGRVLFCLTPGDGAVIAEVRRLGGDLITVARADRGDYQRKINAGYRATTEAHVFLAADDLHFHPGWYAAATAQLRPGIGVVGTNDLGSPRVIAGQHATHSLVTRAYADEHGTIDRPGQILHEGYPHEWCDDELVETAKARAAWAFAADAHVEHLHPNWGKAPTDRLYAQQRIRMRQGAVLYRRRRPLWT